MAAVPPASAAQILLPQQQLLRDRSIEVVYRLDRPATARGLLDVEWRDSLGRIVESFRNEVRLSNTRDVRFSLDLRRAVALDNELHVRLLLDRSHEEASHISFAVAARQDPWRDYQIIIWQPQTARQYAALREIGITVAALHALDKDDIEGSSAQQRADLLSSDLPWYVENIATDFYSPYHRWDPERPVNWRFQQLKHLYEHDRNDPAVFAREPSLSDAVWLKRVGDRLTRTVRTQRTYQPLFYNLADEPGIADLSVFWDFDFSRSALEEFRAWLRHQYGSLAALNRQWATQFPQWDTVTPMTTSEAFARDDENYSAWADFKAWMDEAFARALRAGTDAVHRGSASARAGIEGGQIPGWGGYDYARLSRAVDVMELYDGGGNMEIVRSLNPSIVLLTTTAIGAPAQGYAIWRSLLRGARGTVLWDPRGALLNDNARPSPAGDELADDLHHIRDGIGALLLNSHRVADHVAILYSPGSMRTQWLLDWKPKGDAWATRDLASSYEDENSVRSSMMGLLRLLDKAGLHAQIISPEEVERGGLGRRYRALILPRTMALSAREGEAIRRFRDGGGIVIADSEPGSFDEHSRRLMRPRLHDLFRDAEAREVPGANRRERVRRIYRIPGAEACASPEVTDDFCRNLGEKLRSILALHGVRAALAIEDGAKSVGRLDSYLFQNGVVTIVGLEREPNRASSGSVMLRLRRPAYVYDLRGHRIVGRTKRLQVTIRPGEAKLLALAPAPLPLFTLKGPGLVHQGATAVIRLSPVGAPRAGTDVFHVEVADPSGHVMRHYGGNLIAARGRAALRIPLARNDAPGMWTVRVTDVLGGTTQTLKLRVART